MTGESPFLSESNNEIIELNKECLINFDILSNSLSHIPFQCLDILKNMLEKNQFKRITAQIALNHEWFHLENTNVEEEIKNKFLIRKIPVINQNLFGKRSKSSKKNIISLKSKNKLTIKTDFQKDFNVSNVKSSTSETLKTNILSSGNNEKNNSLFYSGKNIFKLHK